MFDSLYNAIDFLLPFQWLSHTFMKNAFIAILIITHLTKILEYIKPDYVHVLGDGHILKTGDYSLALDIEKDGYKKYLDKSNIMLEE